MERLLSIVRLGVARPEGRRAWSTSKATPFAGSQRRATLRLSLIGLILFLISSDVLRAQAVLPIQDDAALHDVHFVGSRSGWAVGDHGVIRHTTDGGKTWDYVPSPVDCPLRSVCFLTDRVGWIAGGGTMPFTRLGYGVVLFTDNGGQSWKILAKDSIPPIYSIKFFGLERGIAVGAATHDHPTGVLVTKDGGKTWESLAGPRQTGWRAAYFLQPDVGVVAGRSGQLKLVGGERLLAAQTGTRGLENIHAVSLNANYGGWMVGDGGLIRQTDSGGVSWHPPEAQLPKYARSLFNFHAVAESGTHVWIAGNPGSVIWHSSDQGRTWEKQFTGQTVPVFDLHFSSETTGWAVGAMGLILKTQDGGTTWQAVHGGKRRAAILAISARPSRIPFALLTKLSGDEGYRSAVYLPARRDAGVDTIPLAELDGQLQESVAVAGGNFAETGWQLPAVIPGLEQNPERLLANWNARTEGKLPSVFLDDLVKQIRTWRPEVIVLDGSAKNDALAKLIEDTVLQAVGRAADPTLHITHMEYAGLNTWAVKKVYERLPSGSVGDVLVELHEYLPRKKTSLQTAAAQARSRIETGYARRETREAYRLIHPADNHLGGRFFAGLVIAPGSSARRMLLPIDPRQDAQRRAVMKRQRNFHAYVERMISDSRHANQLIGQLRVVTDGMTSQEAALELARLAEDYRQASRWDLVESTLVELVERYPDEPAALDAMRWLFQLWNAAEPAWQRSRRSGVARGTIQTDFAAVQNRIQQALDRASQQKIDLAGYQVPETGPDPVKFVAQEGELKISEHNNWRTGTVAHWQEQAVQMAGLIRRQSPPLFLQPDVQFPLAALMRQRGVYRLSDSYYRRFQRLGEGEAWKANAAAELWLTNPVAAPPKPVLHALNTNRRPKLDGVLSDPCWQAAKIVELKNSANEPDVTNGETAFLMFSYDDEFLYIAGSIPRVEHVSADAVQLAGRKHDADLSLHDRFAVCLDVDRDYATAYTFQMDQRGWTHDACWDDAGFDPQWYVAADADGSRWRIEAAIPFKELVPETPRPNATWAVGISRIMPAVGVQGWPEASGGKPRPEAFGLLRFQ